MITLLLFLSNDKCVSLFIKDDIWSGFIEELNYFDKGYLPNMLNFPSKMLEVNRINDEIEIRRKKSKESIISSIFGELENGVSKMGDEYHYQNGAEFEDSSFHLLFTLLNDGKDYVLTIKRKSNYFAIFLINIPYELLMLMILLNGAIKFRHLCLSPFYIGQK